MDAFAVSISSGILLCKARWGQTFKIAGAFGLFQGIMPFIGYTIARLFARQIQAFDHWIAFGLLVFIGGKMLWEVLRGGEDDAPRGDPCGWMNLLVMAVATSIDAMGGGGVPGGDAPHRDVGREFWLSAVLRRYRGGDLRHLRRGCENRVQNGRHVRPQGGNRWGRGAHRHRRENPARAFAGGMRAGDGGFSGNTSKKYGG